ncbi:MAG TPA: Uma2 family endonuclease [Planctomycetaceae bacterium]|nr:Uma2 family endonuclease [Planctomycetaceae bacterium]
MTALRVPIITASEYLLFEQRSEIKHEFVAGHVYAMAGGKPRHNQISVNLLTELSSALRPTNCVVYNSDQRVRNQPGDTYFYPDCSVACGPRFDAKDPTSLINPALVCEVLSAATQQYDLGEKAELNSRFETVRSLLFVSSEEVRVELRERGPAPDSEWTTTVFTNPDDVVSISALNVTISLAALYAKTDLPLAMRVVENGH